MSEAFTGAPFRLEVVLAIGRLPTEAFATIEVRNVVASDVSQPVVSAQLRGLVAAGFLDKLAHGHYRRLDGPVWDFVRGLEAQAMVLDAVH